VGNAICQDFGVKTVEYFEDFSSSITLSAAIQKPLWYCSKNVGRTMIGRDSRILVLIVIFVFILIKCCRASLPGCVAKLI
jgi:hypothetical protein